ncbi:hypothetical protein [Actinacidiphila guanduensis]|uniref:Uncharacterized protein n=1 Tax=Actinacidiphila guanduensis TaxID=310781 RepID=A0A1H0F9G2_9ACTN|nr:hypothetical protein [Actinacidiphila guanduensis]SDN91162.1 hypothetical protein SAMN05216259_106204 [Actinacidiphila guanduensis]
MHSSGRGEDSPEAYRGVVLPSGQQQPAPYGGEHVQPAGGTPWGAPPEQQGLQAADATQMLPPAEATQMLPPYPAQDPGAGHPGIPVADATQMLPPYPAADPAAGLPPQPGAVPPMPQQAPPAAQPPVAEATQALPLFKEPQQQGYEQYGQPYEQQPGGYPQQGYPGQSYGGGQEPYAQEYSEYEQPAANPAADSDYDHLFRHDVPGPTPVRPRIIQPPDRRQPAGPPPQGGGYGPGYGPEQDYGYADGGDRRKLSPKALIGIVVAGCVVAGLVVGALLNSGGGDSHTGTVADSSTTAPSADPSASGSSSDDAAKQQASSLDALLSTSDASRSSVVNAVASIRSCKDLDTAHSDLTTAAGQRKDLVTKLSTLSVDKLPNHAALTDALTKAWQASSAADSHYANWASQAQNGHKVCKGGHARNTGETNAGDRESGTATAEKKKAVKLWNTIAQQYGLTERQYSQL